MIDLSEYIEESLISFLPKQSKKESIEKLVDLLAKNKNVKNKEAFLKAIYDREKSISTGVGKGLALPHAKLAEFKDFFIAIGIVKDGVDWEAIDSLPVKLIFLIGGPDDKQTQYLKILSQITDIIRDEDKRKKLLTYTSGKEIVKIFKMN